MSLSIRQYLKSAYALYPHIVGSELDTLLWREKHTRYDWKKYLQLLSQNEMNEMNEMNQMNENGNGEKNEEEKIMFLVPTVFNNLIVSMSLKEKMSFVSIIARRKVYIYRNVIYAVDPRKKKMSKKEKLLMNVNVKRIEFSTLHYLPPVPDCVK
jgi:hypothetical protein